MITDPRTVARHAALLTMLYVLGIAIVVQLLYFLPAVLGGVGTYLAVGALIVVGSTAWSILSPRWWPEDRRSELERETDGHIAVMISLGVEPDEARERVKARLLRGFPAPRGDGEEPDDGMPPFLREAMRHGAQVEVHHVGGRHHGEPDDGSDLPVAGRPYL